MMSLKTPSGTADFSRVSRSSSSRCRLSKDLRNSSTSSCRPRLERIAGFLILHDLGLGDSIELVAGDFSLQAHPLAAQEQEVESAVGQSLVLNDLADTTDIHDRTGSDHGRAFGCRPNLHHGDQAVAGQRVFGHLAVTRLEDVQREQGVRKQHDVRQGKQPASIAKNQAILN